MSNFEVCGAVVMQRVELPGKTVKGNKNEISDWPPNIRDLYTLHFENRNKLKKVYGDLEIQIYIQRLL